MLTEWDEFRWLDFDRLKTLVAAPADRRHPQPARPGRDATPRVPVRGSRSPMSIGRSSSPGALASSARTCVSSSSARGDDVVVVDNLSSGRRVNVEQLLDHKRFTFIEADVCKDLPVEGHVDGVMHMASPASPPEYLRMPLETLDVSSIGHTSRARPRPRERRARSSSRPRARCTATRSCTRRPRSTGATSTRSDRAPSTTRPSGSPRRSR